MVIARYSPKFGTSWCGWRRRIRRGLHADPRRAAKRRASRGTLDDCTNPEGSWPTPERPTSWQTFLRAHWGVIAGADFFTTEVWTWRGLVTYYTVFIIDLATRRVDIVGSTPHPNDLFMDQVSRTLTAADTGLLRDHTVLICDRDRKWSEHVRRRLGEVATTGRDGDSRRTNAGTSAECQCVRGALRPTHQGGMPRPHDTARRAPFPTDRNGVRPPLSS
jgi:hypothetical protein